MDARVVKSRNLAFTTAASILVEEGLSALTHQKISQVSGLSRATLYRHWPTVSDLIAELLVTYSLPKFSIVRGTLRECISTNVAIHKARLSEPGFLEVYLATSAELSNPIVTAALTDYRVEHRKSIRDAMAPYVTLTDHELEEFWSIVVGPISHFGIFKNTLLSNAALDSIAESAALYVERIARSKNVWPRSS